MGKRIIRRRLTPKETKQLRSIIRKAQWKRSTSEEYRDAPHQYIVLVPSARLQSRASGVASWQLIRQCGEYRQWRGSRWKYLLIGRWAYWSISPCSIGPSIARRARVLEKEPFRLAIPKQPFLQQSLG